MNVKTFQLLILFVITSCAVSYEISNGHDDFRDSDSDESNDLPNNQHKLGKFWPIQKSHHSSTEWPESHEPRHHYRHSQKSQEWQDSHESSNSKNYRKSHQLHEPIDSLEFQRWEDLTPPPSNWDRAPPWLSCPSLTYHLQCQPGEKKNCQNDSDCGYSQKCCPIVGGGVLGRPLKCCRSYTRPSWWWPTDSPHKPCPHHQTTGAPTSLTTARWWPPTEATTTTGVTQVDTTTPWWWPAITTGVARTTDTPGTSTNGITTKSPTTAWWYWPSELSAVTQTATTASTDTSPTTSGITFPL